jgi:HK97 family phage major capsid protein
MEYREAFKAYAQRGVPIPAKFEQRDGMPANTDTLGATIPTTVLNEFINEIRKVYGNLYAKVRKLNIPGAVKVPIAQLQAQFKWITESTVSPRQDGGNINQFVEFGYNMAEIRVSQTLLSSIVTLDIFEREIVRIMLIAYMQAMDTGIVRGTGDGQMLGILNDPRITGLAGHTIAMSAADINNWTAWRKKFFSKLPLGYRAGEFIFPLSTVESYLETMADANNNPIFRQATGLEVNDGDRPNPNGRFFGREISLVEPDILPDFDAASSGDVIGIFWQPNEYAINTNMAFGMRRYLDEDRNEWVNKMLTVVDGKVLNPMGYYLITKA